MVSNILRDYSIWHGVIFEKMWNVLQNWNGSRPSTFRIRMNAKQSQCIFTIFSLMARWNKLKLPQVGFCTSLLILIKYGCIYRHLTNWLSPGGICWINTMCTIPLKQLQLSLPDAIPPWHSKVLPVSIYRDFISVSTSKMGDLRSGGRQSVVIVTQKPNKFLFSFSIQNRVPFFPAAYYDFP